MKLRLVTAVTAGTVAMLGLVPAAASAAPARAGSAREKFFITDQVLNGHERDAAVVHGAFTAGGKDTTKAQSDVLHLGGGTLTIKHPDKASHFSFHLNKKTCFYTFTGKGTYTLEHGTGRFAGVTGHGSYTVKGQGLAKHKKNGVCNANAQPKAGVSVVRGSGPVTVP